MITSALIALGGNAIVQPGEEGNLEQQYRNTRRTADEIGEFIQTYNPRLVITHGNGPQIGNIIFRSEYSSKVIYPLTLDVCVSDSEGGMGYMIQQILHNELVERGIPKDVVTIITQVVVSPEDEAFRNPTKFIGKSYDREEAERLARERGWIMKEDIGRGWRRVVPSPTPLKIVEDRIVKVLLENDIIVIAAGGGGIPVVESEKEGLFGVEAVVDKDLASALLARSCGIETLIIITSVECVYLNYRQPNEEPLHQLTLAEAKHYLAEGHFPAGNMGPKIEAGIEFLQCGGKQVFITSPGNLMSAIQRKTGTVILP